MVKVEYDVNGDKLPCSIYLDGYMKNVLDDGKKLVQHNWDFISLYVGYEGDGKTTKALVDALYMDASLNIKNVVFNAEQFDEVVDNCKPESSIVWDEADDLGSSWASEMLIALKKKFKRIRKKRLKIFLVTPTFHDLNKYFAITRTRFLVHVYSEGLTRGRFRFFGRNNKRKLYIKGKKEMDMSCVHGDFFGTFTDIPKGFPIDMSSYGEYETKKDEATAQVMDEKKDKRGWEKSWRDEVIPKLHLKTVDKFGDSFTKKELGEIFGVNKANVLRGVPLQSLGAKLIPNSPTDGEQSIDKVNKEDNNINNVEVRST